MSEKEKLTPLMEKYEEETGKHARWGGELTKSYKEWCRKREEAEVDEEAPGVLTRFFSKIGDKVIKTGETTAKAPNLMKGVMRRAGGKAKTKQRERGLSRRLQDLKRLEVEKEERAAPSEWEKEEETWKGGRMELKRPLSQRLADTFYMPLKKPAIRMASFFGGLENDLYSAGMKISAERYISLILGVSIIIGIGGFILATVLFSLLLGLLVGIIGFIFVIIIGRSRPRSYAKNRAAEINQVLPYALRHISTQLSSGIGLAETMTSVSRANYGALSEEFDRTLHDMSAGKSINEALSGLVDRVDSPALNRAVRQIQRTLRIGGDLSDTLSALADEAAFDLRMNLRDYTQSLNMMSMIYMFASAVIPPMLIILLIVMKFMGGGMIPINVIALLYLVGLPFMLFYLVRIFQGMEPGV